MMKFVKSFIVTLALLASAGANANDELLNTQELANVDVLTSNNTQHRYTHDQSLSMYGRVNEIKRALDEKRYAYPYLIAYDDRILLAAQYEQAVRLIEALTEAHSFLMGSNLPELDMPTSAEVYAQSHIQVGPLRTKIKNAVRTAYESVFGV